MSRTWPVTWPKKNKKRDQTTDLHFELMVGAAGFELATPCTPCKCATRLRYAPTSRMRILHESFSIFKPSLSIPISHSTNNTYLLVFIEFYWLIEIKKRTDFHQSSLFSNAYRFYFLPQRNGAICVNEFCCDFGTFMPIVNA